MIPLFSRGAHREAARWQAATRARLVAEVLPRDEPWLAGVVPSWLQPTAPSGGVHVDWEAPSQLALFLPERPLAIDLLWEADSDDWRLARPVVSRAEWERRRERLAFKISRLGSFPCPYLQLWRHQAADAQSLLVRVRQVLGPSSRW